MEGFRQSWWGEYTIGGEIVVKFINFNFYENLIEKLRNANKNYIYIQNSTNHYIPRKMRPDWRVMIRGLIEKIRVLCRE